MKRFAIAGAVLVAGITLASSGLGAEASRYVNVRSGPGTNYRVVDALHRGEHVNVRKCRSSGWCYITHPGPDGWVSARYLRDDTGDDEYYQGRPNLSFSFSFGQFHGGRGNGHGGNNDGGNGGGNGSEKLVCLVTFFEASQVAAGADADVESARLLPKSLAERRDGPNDRRAIFDYGTDQQNRQTCEYLDNLN